MEKQIQKLKIILEKNLQMKIKIYQWKTFIKK